MAKDNKVIYASHKKIDPKKGSQIDEDLTYSSEEDAIEHFIKGLSSIDEDMEKEFNDGDDIKIYLYQLDKNHVPYLYKKVEVEKDDSDKGYEITDEDEEDLPDDFIPYGNDDDSSAKDDTAEDEGDSPKEDENDEEPEPESSDGQTDEESKKDKKTDKGQQEDSGDDVQDLKESVLSLSDEFYDNYGLVEEVANKAHAIIKEFGLNDKETMTESLSYLSEGVDQVLNVLSESIPASNYKDQLALTTIHQYFTEKTLKAKDRKALDDSEFGISSLRKYPIPDKAHVKAAIQRFNYVDSKHEKELADNLIKAMKKFNMMNEVQVGEKNRFKKYIDSSYKEFKESYDIFPFPLELTKEFSVGAMLPMMGSTDGWGTKLANTPIEDVVASNNEDMEKYATLYDTSELENDAIEYRKKIYTGTSLDDGLITREQALCESVIPHRNIIFDKEVEELAKKLKEFINNPKNDFMEDILKKSLNFKKNIYTIKLNEQDGKDSNKVISKIKSCGFRDVDDQGVKVLYEKEVKGLLLTLIYDTVGDKIRVTYEPYDKDKELKESTDDIMTEGVFKNIMDHHSFNVGKKMYGSSWKKQLNTIDENLSNKINSKEIIIDYEKLEDDVNKLRNSVQIVKRERPELLKLKIVNTFKIEDLNKFNSHDEFYDYFKKIHHAPRSLTLSELLQEHERAINWLMDVYPKEFDQLIERYKENESNEVFLRINGLLLGCKFMESIVSADPELGRNFVKIMRKTMRLPVDTVQRIYMKDGTFKESVDDIITEGVLKNIDYNIRASLAQRIKNRMKSSMVHDLNGTVNNFVDGKPFGVGNDPDVFKVLKDSIDYIKNVLKREDMVKVPVCVTFDVDSFSYKGKTIKETKAALLNAPRKTYSLEELYNNHRKLNDDVWRELNERTLELENELFKVKGVPGREYEEKRITDEINTVIYKVVFASGLFKSDISLAKGIVKIAKKYKNRPIEEFVTAAMTNSSTIKYKRLFEATKDNIDEDIRSIVDKLNRKGYKTKYSCSGHTKARIKEDGYRNGIYHGKLYTTARIVFDDDYKLSPPKGWKVKNFDGKIGMYPIAPDYEYKNGVPDDAFEKWKNEYMAELKMWVNGLPDKPGPTEESVDGILDEFSDTLFEDAYFSEKKHAKNIQ